MKINNFKFEVEPWIYAGQNGGEEKVLRITMEVDGKKLTHEKILPNQAPFETEVEMYTRFAVKSIENELRAMNPKD